MTERHRETIRIVASNLHAGGAVQVAASLLDEMALLVRDGRTGPRCVEAEVSSKVAQNLSKRTIEVIRVTVRDRRPNTARYLVRDLTGPSMDTAFVVFGPYYFPIRARRVVMGYADVTSLYPPTSTLGRWERLRLRVRTLLSLRTVARADHVIVETSALADRVRGVTAQQDISVVPNSINRAITVRPRRDGLPKRSELLLAYVTRPYPHKNLEFLPAVSLAAAKRGLKITFLVTLRADEWEMRSPEFRRSCINVGEVSVSELADFYQRADGSFFPSLLEAQSATPLEAMALGLPLFASDRDFNRAVCNESAWYFDPHDANDAVDRIVEALADPQQVKVKQELGLATIRRLPTAADRAERVMQILQATSPSGRSHDTKAGPSRGLRRR